MRVHGRLGGLAAVVAVLVAALLAGGLVGAEPRSAAADPSDRKRRLDRELAELRHDLEGTAADLVDAVLELKRSQADLAEARSAAVAARAALTQARRRDAELATRLAVAEAAVVKAARELRARGAQERATRARVGQLAREAYLTSGLTTLAVALDAESPDEFAGRLSALSAALRTQNGTIERLDVQQAETRARREKLTAARAEVARLKRESEAAVVARAAAERTAAAAEGRVVQVVTRRAAAVGVIQARKQAEQRRVAAMEREQARLAALLAARSRGRSGGSAPDGGSTLSYPVTAPVTSGYGRRYHPVLHYWRLHAGTDFGAPCGAPVRAAASGTVVRAGWAGGYGKQLVIDHGRMRGVSVATSSNHLSRFVVQSGFVRRGQTVAYSGTTGLSTGCHLHFEVWVNGRTVNPMSWL